MKLWAGMGGYSGAALVRDLLAQVARWSSEEKARAAADPFAAAAPQSSSLRFEVRSSYVPLELGFSLNEHSEMRVQGCPLVDLLAAIGLQNARPAKSNKLQYRYSVSAELLPVQLARAALGGHDLRFPYRVFVMQLGWPGKEGQARCILFAEEKSAYE